MSTYVGSSVLRSEDPRLLTGQGRYVDDIVLPNMVHAAFVRSHHAHARITGVDVDLARSMPGVVAVLTLDDLGERFSTRRTEQIYPSPALQQDITMYPLARDEVCFVGEPIAVVLADTRYIAEDAVEMVVVDYEPLPAVVDCEAALGSDSPAAHLTSSDNLMGSLGINFGDIDHAFADAPHVLTETFRQHRGGCHSMECRGVIASVDPLEGGLTVYSSTQAPYLVRSALARYLGEAEHNVRVIAPDVGGGFGPKAGVYPEEMILPVVARLLNRPVKWIEDRLEHFLTTNQQGDQVWSLEVAAESDGLIRGVRGSIIGDAGAYSNYGMILPITTIFPMPGPYAIPAIDVKMDVAFTNTPVKCPVRGAGRPTAAYAMERMIEVIARNLDLDPADVRARNFVRADQFPYEPGHKTATGASVSYDSGDFHGCLEMAKEVADYVGFPARQQAALAEGRHIGIGVSSYIEDTGMGPFEGATVRVEPNGAVQILAGTASQGQGHATAFSQIVADELGVDFKDVTYQSADTATFPLGVGTVASRTSFAVTPAIYEAAREVRDKAIALTSQMLEAAEADLEIANGRVFVKGSPDRGMTLGELAKALMPFNASAVPMGFAPGLEATSYNVTRGAATASGTHIVEAEVDIETGEIELLKYSVAHDCGRMLNPQLVEGQVLGGVVHGIGNALFERMHYDELGQPISVNYGDYMLPLAPEMPPIEIAHQETLSPLNPLGVKGAGEGGTMPAANAVIAAIENALKPFSVVVNDYPVSPERICELLDEAQAVGVSR